MKRLNKKGMFVASSIFAANSLKIKNRAFLRIFQVKVCATF